MFAISAASVSPQTPLPANSFPVGVLPGSPVPPNTQRHIDKPVKRAETSLQDNKSDFFFLNSHMMLHSMIHIIPILWPGQMFMNWKKMGAGGSSAAAAGAARF